MTRSEPSGRAGTGVRFKILGPIEVTCDDVAVRIPPGRQPIILGALLLEPNRVVSIDRLIDVVWDDAPPATARSQVQICVSGLRHAFAGLGVEQPIVTKSPGYLLRVADGQLDSQVFTRLVAEAAAVERQGQREEAVDLLRRALALWRGPALGGEAGSVLRSAAVRLEEAKLSALETCIDLELKLGRHQALIGELGSLVAEHPLRERLRGQLMIALYRAGRPAEALEVYRAGWRIMVDELGLEPGEELRGLEAAILAEDPALQPEVREPAAPEVRPAAGPHQLPADIVDFTGRESLIEQAEAALLDGDSAAVRVVVIAGKAGIGKTSLAVHVAHRVAERRFPDGQLYCDLAGSHRNPVSPADALGRFLRALGVPGSAVPDGLDERAEMYRSLLSGRQLLVVLDDVAAVRQVTPLLPGSGSCAVILTSRMRLTELPGARVLDVDLLPPQRALELLGKVIGPQRVAGESTAATALVRMVGGLPLALRIVAARLAARPHWSLASMVGRLADERRRLDELAHGDLMVRASLLLTYEGLEPTAARLFRLLSALNLATIPSWVAAALLDEDPMEAAGLLERLVDMQMLDVAGVDLDGQPRYGFHAIIRLFAREQLSRADQQDRRDAVRRVLGAWLARTDQAYREVFGTDYAGMRGTAPRWRPAGGDPDPMPVDPTSWMEVEGPNLIAAVDQAADEGLDEHCWELAVRLTTLFEVGGYADEWQQTHERALDVVRRADNRRGESAVLCSLGELYLGRRRFAAARAVLEPALSIAVALGDLLGIAVAKRNLALLDYHEGDTDRALAGFWEALDAFRRLGMPIGHAYVLSKIARISADRGNYELATDQLGEALDLCREAGSRRIEGQVLYRLGQTLLSQGRHDEADLVLGTALEVLRGNHDIVGEAFALHALGTVRAKLGRRADAVQLLGEAISLREKMLDSVGMARVYLDLAPLLAQRGEQAQAVELVQHAVTTFGERKAPALESEARRLLESLTDLEHVST
ncbi:MAG TPA: BTAD domain-containing putative transcriptional regulator [Actinophytocola sp.]|uniref:AfsR/SARP family transcriptional regulator n=1 Tax=Actinophytocola sp. TaxID=1872138 RepID=UPI002DDD00D9|nr:BTAD domain-containing putative transcriptional regulator [Actinophytocola sp.]HEV2777841.1 BTAD domain-containing putative transcriptional regulator [Actinophytocola sp.]